MNNPYAPPNGKLPSKLTTSTAATIGLVFAILGGLTLLYGALGFWVFNGMFPNGGASGRLPSVYVMGIGIVLTLVGFGVRGIGAGPDRTKHGKQVNTFIGIAAIVLVLGILFLIVANL